MSSRNSMTFKLSISFTYFLKDFNSTFSILFFKPLLMLYFLRSHLVVCITGPFSLQSLSWSLTPPMAIVHSLYSPAIWISLNMYSKKITLIKSIVSFLLRFVLYLYVNCSLLKNKNQVLPQNHNPWQQCKQLQFFTSAYYDQNVW